jgi:hypothetical protein
VKTQSKSQKQAEISYRRRTLEQRLGIKTFNHSYKFGEREFYINNWVKPQISKFKKIIDEFDNINIKMSDTLELGAESGHLSAYLVNHFNTRISIASDISDSLIKACPFVVSQFQFKHLPKIVISDNYFLPFRDRSFDFVFGASVLHHFPNPYAIM